MFNLEQTEGISIPEIKKREFNPITEAEKVIHGMREGPFLEDNGSQAYYRPSDDVVNMPKANLFESDEEYYSTIFHELIHSTGHVKRLNREGITNISHFGSHDYSKEELVAEMGSAFLCGHCGIEPRVIQNQAAYIQSWLKKLRSNKKWLVYAAAAAQKAADYTLNIEHEEDSLPGGNRTGKSENVTPNYEKGVTL